MARSPRWLGGQFHLLWGSQSLSLIGDQITLIALPLVAVESFHAGPFAVGALGACLRFPFLIIGLPAGVWVTRRGLLRSMIAADVLRGIGVAVLPLAIIAGARNIGLLFAGALAIGAGTVFFQVAYQSVVPELISDDERWHAANTRLSLSESLALFAGPALGGLAVAALTPKGGLGLDALSYAASVAGLSAIVVRRRRARDLAVTPDPPRATTKLRAEISEGIRYVRENRVLNAIMWTGALYNLGSSMYDALIVVFAVKHLHISPVRFGIVIGIGAIGFPVGSLISKYANAKLGLGPSLVWAAIPSVGGMIVAASASGHHPEILLAAGTLLVGVGQGCFAVNAITLRQLHSTPSMRARATSVHRFLSWGALPIGAVIAGAVGQTLGLRTAMLASGLVACLCFIPLLKSPLRYRAASERLAVELDAV